MNIFKRLFRPGLSNSILIKQNLFANYAGTAISIAMPLLTLPIFLSLLGEHLWGLVAFFWMLIGLLSIIEIGVNQALIREFGNRLYQANPCTHNLIYTYERLYWIGASISAIMLLFASDFITAQWLNLNGIPHFLAQQTVYAASIMIALTIPASLYRAILLAAKTHIRLNKLIFLFAIVRYGGGAIAVYLHPSVTVYVGWQVFISIAELCLLKLNVNTALPHKDTVGRWDFKEIKSTRRSVIQLLTATLLSAFTVQFDKLVISTLLPIQQLGYYAIAVSLTQGILRLVYPIQSTLLPHLVSAQNFSHQILRYNRYAYFLTFGLIFAIGISYALVGELLLRLWLSNKGAAAEVSQIMPLLLLGAAFNALYGIQYVNWLALGQSLKILQFNLFLLLIALACTPLAVKLAGLEGAGLSWIMINLTGMLAGVKLMGKSLKNA